MSKGFVLNVPLSFGKLLTKTIGGTVKDLDDNFLEREVRLYRGDVYLYNASIARTPYGVTYSDPLDGTYSFTVPAVPNETWTVECIGQNGENTEIYTLVVIIYP